MRNSLGKTLRQLWWAPFVCLGLAWLVSRTNFGYGLEGHALDWRTRYRLDFQPVADPRFAVVLFEDHTETLLEKSWPVDRAYHAQMTQVLALAGAKVIVWDVILDDKRAGEGDTRMGQIAEAAQEAGSVVLSAATYSERPTDAIPGRDGPTKPFRQVVGDIRLIEGNEYAYLPFPQLRAVSLYGFADVSPGSDGMRRWMPLVLRVGQEVYPSLSLQIVLGYLGVNPDDVRVELGDAVSFTSKGRQRRIPIDSRGRFLVNYRHDQVGHPTDFPVYRYGMVLVELSEVLLEEKKPTRPLPDFKDRIVILGQTVRGKADAGLSPLQETSPFSFLVANAVSNVLADDHAWRVPDWIAWLAALLFGCAWVVGVADRSVVTLCAGTVLAGVAYISLALWAWVFASWWVPLVHPLAGFGALGFLVIGRRVWQEHRAKQEIKGMFGSYVSPEIVERMIKSDKPPELGGHEEQITAYFSDIQGYSSFSEKLPPAQLVRLLNEYLTVCTDTIQAEGGTLDKYIGDAVVAIFGAPSALPDHAYRACRAAVLSQERLGELRARWTAEGNIWPQDVQAMRSRIGLNSGPAIIGNMGSRTRFSYTMTGDNVNLAARMESGAKSWGSFLMCTGTTKAECEKHGGDALVFRALGRIVVVGRSHPVEIFDVVGLRKSVAAPTLECVATFEAALARYHERDWQGALEGFIKSAALEPLAPGKSPGVKSNPSLEYQRIARECQANPPEGDWNGVFVMKGK
jgi:adenylate cyclase